MRRIVSPNTALRDARLACPSQLLPGTHMSRSELATTANALLHAKDILDVDINAGYVAKLEAGEYRWPRSPHRRWALRTALKVEGDADIGLYPDRLGRQEAAKYAGSPPASATNGVTSLHADRGGHPGLGLSVDEGKDERSAPPGKFSGDDSLQEGGEDGVGRRLILQSSLFGAAFAFAPSALSLDDLERILAVARDARRYLDVTVVRFLQGRLDMCAAEDGAKGPRAALPDVLGVLATVQASTRAVKPNVRCSLLGVGARAAEFAGWLYRDAGMPDAADYWRDRATEWSMESGEYATAGYILVKKSQAAWDYRDAGQMLTLAQAGLNGPWALPVKVRAEAAQQAARGHAMLERNMSTAEGKLSEARECLSEARGVSLDDGPLASHYDAALFAVQTAMCYAEAGQSEKAVEIYSRALSPEVFSNRDHAYFLALKAQAITATHRPDEAATAGMEALPVAVAAGSVRTVRELSRLRARLRPWDSRPQVRAFVGLLSSVT